MISSASAVISIAALDVRRRPSHRSELRSQLLMGEQVAVLSLTSRGKWARIENGSDGYRGWVRTWGLRSFSEEEARGWASRALWRVSCRHLELRSGRARGVPIGPLFWNSAVVVSKVDGGLAQVELPNGSVGWTERANLRRMERKAGPLSRVIRSFHGIPYLWGGRTPLGFDCSGFVQQALAGVGVAVPRDAHQQFRACHRLAGAASTRLGDLLFFGSPGGRMTHVGLALGKGLYAHARGTVRVNSLLPSNPMYDKELAKSFRAAGRP